LVSKSETGAMLVFVGIFAMVLLGFAAISVDVGQVYVTRARIQEAGDAAALAAVKSWAAGATADATHTIATEFGSSNGVLTNEVVSINVGYWNDPTKTFNSKDPLDPTDVPAVEVTLKRKVPLGFAGLFGFRQMSPQTVSLAIAARANAGIGI